MGRHDFSIHEQFPGSPGSPGDGTCADWTASTGEVQAGNSRHVGLTGYSALTLECGEEASVYCLQE